MSRKSRDPTRETGAATGREEEARRRPSGREPIPTRPSPDQLRRLGPLEYILLSLIALGIAITVAMALLNP